MKHALRLLLISLFVLIALPSDLQAQVNNAAVPTATFDNQMQLQLPGLEAMPMMFEADIVALGLDDKMATRYFASISDNLVHYQLVPNTTKVQIRPQYGNLSGGSWTPAQWQQYLQDRAPRYLNYLNRFKSEQ